MDKAKQSEYNKRYYQSRKAEKLLAAAPESVPGEPGPVEAATLAEIELNSLGVGRPGLVAGALAMARTVDNPLHVSQRAACERQRRSALDELWKTAGQRGKRLASVQKLSRRVS